MKPDEPAKLPAATRCPRHIPLLVLPAVFMLTSWQYVAGPLSLKAYGTTLNPIQHENSLPVTTAWQVTKPSGHGEIQAYVGLDSVNQGQNEPPYVSTKGVAPYK